MDEIKEVKKARKALKCLRLEVPESIVDDIENKVEAAFKAIASYQADTPASISLPNSGKIEKKDENSVLRKS